MIFYRLGVSNTLSMCILNLWQMLEEDAELHPGSRHGFIVRLDPQEQAAFVYLREENRFCRSRETAHLHARAGFQGDHTFLEIRPVD